MVDMEVRKSKKLFPDDNLDIRKYFMWKNNIDDAPRDKVILLYGTLYGPAFTNCHPQQKIIACGYWDVIDEAWVLTDTAWDGPFIKPTHWDITNDTPE